MGASFPLEPVLEVGEIQGNILGGFNKDLQLFVFLRMPERKDAPVRKWLSECVDRLTWLDEVVRFKRQFRALTAGLAGADPGHLASTWMNVALSYPALARLSADATEFDSVFQWGMPGAVGRLGDPTDPSIRGHISQWKFGSSGMVPDILLIIAADREDDLGDRLERERVEWSGAGLLEIHIDQGRDLSRTGTPGSFPPGLEHFGFKDGISQPAIRGRISEADNDYLNPRDGVERPGTTIEYASPGSPLICPGEFVLGYPKQSDSLGREASEPWPLGPQSQIGNIQRPSMGPLWAKNGSFLVYRRLNQDVPAFNRFLREAATRLSASEVPGLTPERFGAMVMGRWRSGAPLLRAVENDDFDLAHSKGSNNDFDFLNGGSGADQFPPALADATGDVCPAAAHIRKVNPRSVSTDQGGEVRTLVRRILRRGIPFGDPLPIGSEDDPEKGDRGLLFFSYQASIQNQFEFLQSAWANSEAKPTSQLTGKAGHDLVIGQNPTADRSRFILVGVDQTRVDAPPHVEWVFPTAGAYFFSPSRTALSTMLGSSGPSKGRSSTQGASQRRRKRGRRAHGNRSGEH